MSGTAWTYTSASGDSMETAYHCDNWQSISASAKGHVGDITATDTQWTDKGPGETVTCNTQHHLYCIQD